MRVFILSQHTMSKIKESIPEGFLTKAEAESFAVAEAQMEIWTNVSRMRHLIGHERTMRWVTEEVLHRTYEELPC